MTIREQDIFNFSKSFQLAEHLEESSFLITGGTGLVGSTLVECLLSLNKNINITLPVRSFQKTKDLFGEKVGNLCIVQCNLLEYIHNLTDSFDYIIHCASPTSGHYMTEHPVETYSLVINTTRAILELCRRTSVKSFVYISSLEYYGEIYDDRIITEDVIGYVDYTSTRSCYPLGKRAAEYFCVAYSKEYGVPVKIARLTQTFGAGIAPDDNRVFAQFARSVINGTDIILHTKGESAKPYCYTTDCASAILYILLKGGKGEAYNVANEDSYITVADMAKFLRDNFNPSIEVRVEEHSEMGYAPVTKLHLSASKLMSLGWVPKYGLEEIYKRLLESIR